MATMAAPLIEMRGITKTYVMGDQEVHALLGVDLSIHEGEFVAIMGASGSGKSTMMNILGCLDRPTSGQYILDGKDVAILRDDEQAIVRNRTIGFVFQSFNLLRRTSAMKNVELPLIYSGVAAKDRTARARAALEQVGLGSRMDHQPSQLSGGQQQRVAVARALVTDPPLILADEPTGNLDSRVSNDVMQLFKDLNDRGLTIVLVTHESDIAAWAKRVVRMRDGAILSDTLNPGRSVPALLATDHHLPELAIPAAGGEPVPGGSKPLAEADSSDEGNDEGVAGAEPAVVEGSPS